MNKKIIILFGSIVAFLVCIYIGYNYWTSTPSYCIHQIKAAINNHDIDLFNKYVDVNTLSNRLFDDRMGIFQKNRVIELFKEQIEIFIERGDLGDDSATNNPNHFISLMGLQNIIDTNIRDVKYTKTEGKISIVGLNIYNKKLDKILILELKLREKDDGHWQLIEIQNLHKLLIPIQNIQDSKIEDSSNLLTKEQQNEIQRILFAHNQNYLGRIHLQIIPKLPQNLTIEEYSFQCLDRRPFLANEKNDRILIVIALANHKIRITTSQDVVTKLGDKYCGEVIEKYFIPSFKKNDYYQGVIAGLKMMIEKLEKS